MRPAIVGEAPGMRTARPFDGRSGQRLADLAGLEPHDLRARFRLVNLLPYWPGPGGKGSAFPLGEARERAVRMRLPDGSVLCGRRVAAAFGIRDAPLLEWVDLRGRAVAVAPHPSGISHWWNDADNVGAARAFFRELARG